MPISPSHHLLAAFGILLVLADQAMAQAVRGRVIDADTGAPVSGAYVRLLAEDDAMTGQATTSDAGVFYVMGRGGASRRVEASHIAYDTASTELQVGFDDQVVADIRLKRKVIEIAPLTVTASGGDPTEDATYEGLYARRSEFPRVGTRRALLHSDVEMRSRMRLWDMVRTMEFRPKCRVVYWNGRLVQSAHLADEWISDTALGELEGLEFYKRPIDAPAVFRDVPRYLYDNAPCNVIVLWQRRSDP
jgi:hypothetical protein